MKVLFHIGDFLPGGAQKQCALLANALTKNGISLAITAVQKGPNLRWLSEDIAVEWLAARNSRDLSVLFGLSRFIGHYKPDVVVSWLHPADTHVFFLRALCRLRGVKWVMTERDSSYPNGMLYRFRDFFGRYSDRLVANSQAGAERWMKLGLPAVQCGVVGNIQIGGNELALPGAPRRWDVGVVGRLEPQKNPLRALSALRCATTVDSYYIAGSGSLSSSIDELIAADSERGSNMGYIEDPQSVFGITKVFLTLSHHEGTPNALMEAVAAGCIPVASRIASHIETLGADYPFLVQSDASPQSIAIQIERALGVALDSSVNELILAHARRLLNANRADAIAESFLKELKQVHHE